MTDEMIRMMLRSLERVRGRTGGGVKLGVSGERGSLSMADLDEVLFPLSGLLDFSAALTRDHGKDRLHIDIHAMGSDREAEAMVCRAMSALGEIPCVRAARDEGALLVSIDVRREAAGTGKRRILDRT